MEKNSKMRLFESIKENGKLKSFFESDFSNLFTKELYEKLIKDKKYKFLFEINDIRKECVMETNILNKINDEDKKYWEYFLYYLNKNNNFKLYEINEEDNLFYLEFSIGNELMTYFLNYVKVLLKK